MARLIHIQGRVQGVGFRPHIYRLAHTLGLDGHVQNLGSHVEVLVAGSDALQDQFIQQIIEKAPPLAKPVIQSVKPSNEKVAEGFRIIPSAKAKGAPFLPPDQFCCDDCLEEIQDPAARRYQYPFTNCTQCGPRYTLIAALPYDRPNTAMADFPLCPACAKEYGDPLDRRFHAQPLACPVCGPQLSWQQGDTASLAAREEALQAALEALKRGEIIAVKGVGGYHLLCDATREESVATLRSRKRRPHKPLAIMLPQVGADGLAMLQRYAEPSKEHLQALLDPVRPIVLMPLKPGTDLAPSVAPGLDEVGVMLPYSPLHHLLLQQWGRPLVATSGNISGEPVLIDALEAEQRLKGVVDGFLHHNRPILRPADDGVVRVIHGRARMLRPGRGMAPVELELPLPLPKPTLAVGGHMKNAVALGWNKRVVLSPHIGEMDAPRTVAIFKQVCGDLQRIHGVQAERVVHDHHHGYTATREAEQMALPTYGVGHHAAHASALAGEHGVSRDENLLVFTWDGVGLGTEPERPTLWGGELLYGGPGRWQRVGSMRPFRLPGGDKVGREPWRAALSLCWQGGLDAPFTQAGSELLKQAWQRGLNAPVSSAVGRLFDGAAALMGLITHASFEGQGPFMMEALCRGEGQVIPLPLSLDEEGVLRLNWALLIHLMMDETLSQQQRSEAFHSSMAAGLIQMANHFRATMPVDGVGLTGGVFQNRWLTEQAVVGLEQQGYSVLLHEKVPMNDGGLAYGQLVEWAFKAQQCK
uniref:Carbamoyltransferase HypF n=1 Tax=Magnetococcus massalia (strain MO-1) TaxID=451514 RepID=A0A1S7LDK3_MAGMO|nr:(NiFe) hydrogenase maturation protein HypF(Carbamoyltransferase) [Candidatus Magnetococcus massalia]